MSKITLAPNAAGTGTLTVAAPNTNTDRTLTLPDVTTTLVGTDATQTLTNKSIASSQLTGAVTISSSAPSQSLNVDASGCVGIGTTSPGARLAVASSATDNALIIRNTSTAASTSKTSVLVFDGTDTIGTLKQSAAIFSLPADNNYVGSSMVFYTRGSDTLSDRGRIDSAGALILVGSTAQKATGTTWSNPSDQRLKTNIMDYPKGINELMQVRVREWEYNGKGNTTAGMAGLGVIADEVMTVLPNTVDTYDAKLDEADEETTAIKKFDATEITWLLVKAVQEQQAIITALETRIAALEVI